MFADGFSSWQARENIKKFISPIPKAKTNPEYQKKGLNCCVSSWQRIHDNALPPRIKCGANYINSRLAQLEALDNGYDTVIFLNHHGNVAEGPGSCLFMVRDNTLITPLLTDSVLESITRDTVITLAKELGINVTERTVDRTELYLCDEAFLCGSAMEITPVVSVDHYTVGDGTEGTVTNILHRAYLQTVNGETQAHMDWLTEIYEHE
ncbi:Branched-chain-amino-acid aminotransferase [bioreactor metagenome]|uniref:Branched-chain-amino-acid aminotransferase n=1 Tax=bioreactor metagenome TaxID=1076179 RepID=A0A645GAJ6_9ZZZZ